MLIGPYVPPPDKSKSKTAQEVDPIFNSFLQEKGEGYVFKVKDLKDILGIGDTKSINRGERRSQYIRLTELIKDATINDVISLYEYGKVKSFIININ